MFARGDAKARPCKTVEPFVLVTHVFLWKIWNHELRESTRIALWLMNPLAGTS